MGNIYNIGFSDEDGEGNPPIEQGATFELPFTVDNIFANGGVGCLIRGKYRTAYDAPESVEFVCEIQEATAESLRCMASLTATITAGMAAGRGVYDIEIEGSDGFVLRALEGKVKVTPEATK